MIDQKHRILLASIRKLLRRGADRNIRNICEKSRPVDIAEIFDELEATDQLTIFNLLPSDEFRAQVMSHLDEETQVEIVEKLPSESLNTIVTFMDADDQADLLNNLDEELSQSILGSMEKEDKEEIEDLLQYPGDTAGGLMTTEIFDLDQSLTVKETIQALQEDADEAVATFYVYVTDEDRRLVGVLSLKQLLLSKPTDVLKEIMIKDTVSVTVATKQQEVAKIVERYDFLSVPVIDESNTLMGAITVDDIIDVIREEAREDLLAMGQTRIPTRSTFVGQLRSRFPWLSLSFFGGVLIFFVVWKFVGNGELSLAWLLASSLPLLLMVGMTVSNQTTTLAVQAIRDGKLVYSGLPFYLLNELQIASVVGFVSGLFWFAILSLFGGINFQLSALLGVALFVQVALAIILGVLIPWVLQRLQLDPAVGSLSLTAVISQLLTILFALSFVSWGLF